MTHTHHPHDNDDDDRGEVENITMATSSKVATHFHVIKNLFHFPFQKVVSIN